MRCALVIGLIGFCLLVATAPHRALASAVIVLSPEEGEVGASVIVTGSGFTPFAEVSIEFGGDLVSTSPSTVQADDEGEFIASIDVPDYTSAGIKTVAATEDSETATSASGVFTVINSRPIASSQILSLPENSPGFITLTADDANGDSLVYFIIDRPSHGALSDFDDVNGELVYTPETDFNGLDSFSFAASDDELDSNAASISFYIGEESENNPPVAEDRSVATNEDNSLEITLEASDIDGDDLTFTIVGGPSHGTLGGSAPDLVYTPAADYAGIDDLIFSVNDGSEDSSPATVHITITAVNDPPVAPNKSVNVQENAQKAITLIAADVDGDSLSYRIISGPSQGTLTGNPPILYYGPPEDYTGHDSFTYVANDGIEDSVAATVSIKIVSPEDDDEADDYYDDEYDEGYYGHENAPPVANSLHVSGTEDIPLDLRLSASDTEGDSLTFLIVDYPSHGNVSDFHEGLGTLTYIPSSEYSGSDSFTFKVGDDYGESQLATVSISVIAVNDPPRAVSQNLTAIENKTGITLTAFDLENDSLNYTIIRGPVYGNLTGTAPNLVYDLLEPDFVGKDGFTFSVNDGELESNVAIVSISIGGAGDDDKYVVHRDDTDGGNEGADNSSNDNGHASGKSEHGTKSKSDRDESISENDGSTSVLHISKGNMMVLLSWEHNQRESDVESTLTLQFRDRMTRAPFASHIWYDLVILDGNNDEILRKQDLVAFSSADIQQISFPANGTYHLEVVVKGMIDRSNNSIKQDNAYTGSALATVVVPEFNSTWLMIMAATIMGSLILALRFVCDRRAWKLMR